MKNILKLVFGFLLLTIMVSACEDLLGDECSECCLVTYDADWNEIDRRDCVELCTDDEIADYESQSPVTIGDNTTQAECN